MLVKVEMPRLLPAAISYLFPDSMAILWYLTRSLSTSLLLHMITRTTHVTLFLIDFSKSIDADSFVLVVRFFFAINLIINLLNSTVCVFSIPCMFSSIPRFETSTVQFGTFLLLFQCLNLSTQPRSPNWVLRKCWFSESELAWFSLFVLLVCDPMVLVSNEIKYIMFQYFMMH